MLSKTPNLTAYTLPPLIKDRKVISLQCFKWRAAPRVYVWMLRMWMLICVGVLLLIYYATVMNKDNYWRCSPRRAWSELPYDDDDPFSKLEAELFYDNYITNATLNSDDAPPPPGYLVWSNQCKIRSMNPYDPEMMKVFKREKIKPCSNLPPLTSVRFNKTSQRYVLRLEEERLRAYTMIVSAVKCCYEPVYRAADSPVISPDNEVWYGPCVPFSGPHSELPSSVDSIIVTCHLPWKRIYASGHAMLPAREEVNARLRRWQSKNLTSDALAYRPPNVLLIGTDSVSRMQLIRALPQTTRYLRANNWFELKGYNKVGENSYLNMMPLLSGYSGNHGNELYPPTIKGALDKCPLLWRLFREHGYVTGYGEDVTSIGMFNFLSVGFVAPPTDYYLRPFMLGAESRLDPYAKGCLGPRHCVDAVHDYTLEFARRFRDVPHFGLFWTNSLSHDHCNECSGLDEKLPVHLRRLARLGALHNTIVVFFSDHGCRFVNPPADKSLANYFEARLPFLFVWLPPSVRRAHPEFVRALQVNQHRLISPYDMHMTLRHILTLSGRTTAPHPHQQPAFDCPNCQSILLPVPRTRSCAHAGIDDEFCTCLSLESTHKNLTLIRHIALKVVQNINTFVQTFKNGSVSALCAPLSLNRIESAYRINVNASDVSSASAITYRFVFSTRPNGARFETTVTYDEPNDTIQKSGEVARLNSYSKDAKCVHELDIKRYCVCHGHGMEAEKEEAEFV